jgi:molecular chaperone GrpE
MSEGSWDGRVPVIDEDEEPEQRVEGASSTEEGELSTLQEELADLRERSARTLADFENYRRRVERDRREDRRYGALRFAGDVVGVVDNLERALAAGGSVDDLKAGVEMTLRQLREVLERHDVRRVEAVGRPFDPNVHEAVTQLEDPTVTVATVAEELQPGYTLHDRLVRPAVVAVALPTGANGTDSAENED